MRAFLFSPPFLPTQYTKFITKQATLPARAPRTPDGRLIAPKQVACRSAALSIDPRIRSLDAATTLALPQPSPSPIPACFLAINV